MITPYLAIFGIGGTEFLLIAILFIAFFGVEKVPETARALGRFQAELKAQAGKYKTEEERASEHDLYRDSHAKAVTAGADEVTRAAVELGIEVEGKTADELKREIRERVG